MKTFYVTVGQRYATEPHPLSLHPDGWLEVIANDRDDARITVYRACGTKWTNMYDAEDFKSDQSFYPRGCLARITADSGEPNTQ